jgi:hypothetical protein
MTNRCGHGGSSTLERRLMGATGTTLIEVLVATLVLVSGVLGIAQLFLLAAATNAAARDTTITATLAAQKVDELLSSDLSVAADLVDYVDGWGRPVSGEDSPPRGAVFTRRWSIEPLSPDVVAIRVRVGRSDRSGGSGPMVGETRVFAIRPRRRP